MWDVSESTVKRWADAGMLKCFKTIGGHRKFDFSEIVEFQNRSGAALKGSVPRCDPAEKAAEVEELLAHGDIKALAACYQKAALCGQNSFASFLLNRARQRGLTLARIGDEIVKPAMQEIGEQWRAGKIGVLDEHIAISATFQAVAGLNSNSTESKPGCRLAVTGCSEGEFHCLASTLIGDMLKAAGWSVIALGPHTPLFTFASAIGRFKPDLLCLSITMTEYLERAARDYEALRRAASKHGTRIVVGGRAMDDEQVRARFRGAHYAATLSDLAEMIETTADKADRASSAG